MVAGPRTPGDTSSLATLGSCSAVGRGARRSAWTRFVTGRSLPSAGAAGDPARTHPGRLRRRLRGLDRAGAPARRRPAWLPEPIAGARAVVLLVLDGLGWDALGAHADRMPNLAAMAGGPVTTVVPSTTAAALTSITTGLAPSVHGVIGFRIAIDGDVLNVLGSQMARSKRPPDPSTCSATTRSSAGRRWWRAVRRTATGLHRGAPARRALRRLPRRVDARRAPARPRPRRRAVRVRLLPGRRRGRPRLRPPRRLLRGGAGRGRPARRRGARRAARRRRRSSSPPTTGRCTSVPTAGARSAASASSSRTARATGASATSTRRAAGQPSWPTPRPMRRARRLGVLPRRAARRRLARSRSAPVTRRRVGDVVLAAHEAVAFVDPALPREAHLVSAHGSLTRAEMLVPLVGRARGASRDDGRSGNVVESHACDFSTRPSTGLWKTRPGGRQQVVRK